ADHRQAAFRPRLLSTRLAAPASAPSAHRSLRGRLPRDRNGGVGVLELSGYPARIVVGAMSHGSRPGHGGARLKLERGAMAGGRIEGAGLRGGMRLASVEDHLAHVLDHCETDEPSGAWTGLAFQDQ